MAPPVIGASEGGADVDGVPFNDGRLTLTDGRVLAWRWWGDGEAPTILRLQGSANCRLSGTPRLWRAMGIRVLAADRPGFGHSTRRPGRGLRVVADDLAFLLDALALDVVPVIGHSAGGPHALAFAACHGDRVGSVSAVSGACHLTADERAGVVKANRDAAAAAEQGWDALHSYLQYLARALVEGATADVLDDVVDTDLGVVAEAERRVRDQSNRAEALRQGAAGWADETLAIMGDWDFDLDAVQARVTWFHGTHDNTVPISAARRLAQQLPTCELIEIPSRGHRVGTERRAIQRLFA